MEGLVFSKPSRQYLMGIAIIGVVLVHVSTQHPVTHHWLSTFWQILFSNGHIGVNIFFVLSTYGLCYSYNNNDILNFYKKRFLRLWPIFPTALIARYFVKGYSTNEAIERFFSEVTGLFIFVEKRDFFWYMGILTILYIMFPIIYKLSDITKKYRLYILFFLCALSWLGISFDFKNNDIYLATITRIPCMYIGIFSFLCERENDTNTLYIGYGLCALLSLTQIHPMTCLFVPSAMLLIAKSSTKPFARAISFLGKHSLEIYLGHTFAVYHILGFSYSYPINIMLFFFAAALYSTLLYFVQEIFIQLLKRAHKVLKYVKN